MVEAEEKKNSKVFVGLYITFCVLFITWLTSKFFKGRRQIHQAFDTIGQQLQRMQEQLDQRREAEEERQLENSNGDGEKLCPVVENDPEKAQSKFAKAESESAKAESKHQKERLKDE